MKILIAEDDPDGRGILQQICETREGWQVTVAENGAVAWWHLSNPDESPYDLLVTDLDMPVASGLDLVRRVRRTRALSNLQVIICSGKKDRDTVHALIKLGTSGYILKPYEAKAVLQKIESLVKDRPIRSINIALGAEA